MTAQLGAVQTIRKHNRPYLGLWYLKRMLSVGADAVSFQLSHHKRYWAADPIFMGGDALVILSVVESNRSSVPGRLGWEVKALDQKLNPFEFFWDDETSFRSMWER